MACCFPTCFRVEKAPDIIEVDDTSKEIFGEDGLAELNDVMRQLQDLQLGLTTGFSFNF